MDDSEASLLLGNTSAVSADSSVSIIDTCTTDTSVTSAEPSAGSADVSDADFSTTSTEPSVSLVVIDAADVNHFTPVADIVASAEAVNLTATVSPNTILSPLGQIAVNYADPTSPRLVVCLTRLSTEVATSVSTVQPMPNTTTINYADLLCDRSVSYDPFLEEDADIHLASKSSSGTSLAIELDFNPAQLQAADDCIDRSDILPTPTTEMFGSIRLSTAEHIYAPELEDISDAEDPVADLSLVPRTASPAVSEPPIHFPPIDDVLLLRYIAYLMLRSSHLTILGLANLTLQWLREEYDVDPTNPLVQSWVSLAIAGISMGRKYQIDRFHEEISAGEPDAKRRRSR